MFLFGKEKNLVNGKGIFLLPNRKNQIIIGDRRKKRGDQ